MPISRRPGAAPRLPCCEFFPVRILFSAGPSVATEPVSIDKPTLETLVMATRKRILIVDDNDLFRDSLSEQVRLREEFAPVGVATGDEALQKAKSDRFDVIILNIGLPDIDGREVCRLIRRDGVTTPIIMLTGRDSNADTILALDAGADDYVTKPFHIGILLARLRAHIRQHERVAESVIAIGPLTLRPADKVLLDEGTDRRIRLTKKEMEILKCLHRAGGRTVDRDALLAAVWGYNAAVETRTLDTHVYRLRRKIERDPANPRILVTERGGYRLVLEDALEKKNPGR